MTLADRITQRLEALDLSMRAASLKAGLSTHFIQNVIADPDKGISTKNLRKLAEALETSASWLLDGVGDEAQSAEVVKFYEVWGGLSPAAKDRVMDFTRFQAEQQKKES